MYERKLISKIFTGEEAKKMFCFEKAVYYYLNMGLYQDKLNPQIVLDVKNFSETIYRFVTGESSPIESVLEDMIASIIKEGMDLSIKYSEENGQEENEEESLVESIEIPDGYKRWNGKGRPKGSKVIQGKIYFKQD